jgi:hypothetical protein
MICGSMHISTVTYFVTTVIYDRNVFVALAPVLLGFAILVIIKVNKLNNNKFCQTKRKTFDRFVEKDDRMRDGHELVDIVHSYTTI